MVLYWRHCIRVISCHYFVNQKLFNIKLTWVLRGMMDVFHVYCVKSTQIVKNRILSDSLLGNKLYVLMLVTSTKHILTVNC